MSSSQAKILFWNSTKDVQIELKCFRNGSSEYIVGTKRITHYTAPNGAKIEVYCPFKIGERYNITALQSFASGYGYDLKIYTSGDSEDTGNEYASKTLTFTVKDNADPAVAIEGASVTFNGGTKATDASGHAVFYNAPEGTGQIFTVTKTGKTAVSSTVNVSGNSTKNVTMTAA